MSGHGSIQADIQSLWQETVGDPSVTIAFLDGGIDHTHGCFAGADLRELVPAWLNPRPGLGTVHGTHVASIVFGHHASAVKGLAPRCRGIAIPVYGDNGDGTLLPCTQMDLARAVSLARGEGAQIINISGGQLTPTGAADPFLADQISKCAAHDVLVIAATGNDGCECLHVPAALPNVLGVGAADDAGRPLPFSNWGEAFLARGILAPGEDIWGAIPGGEIAPRSGTSFAAPIVTGLAALLLSIQRARGEKVSPNRVRDAILETAIPCSPGQGEDCSRMLAGLLNPLGAYEHLFGPADREPRPRIPDLAVPAQTLVRRSGVTMHGIELPTRENADMVDQSGNAGVEPGVTASQIGQIQSLMTQLQGLMANPAVANAITTAQLGATIGTGAAVPASAPVSLVEPAEARPAKETKSARYEGGCGCGGSNVTPSSSAAPQMPENDFITFRNSQLVYSVGELGYDFGTEARRDYFSQRFLSAFKDSRLRSAAKLAEGSIPLPENYKAMAVYLTAATVLAEAGANLADINAAQANQADANALIWTLTIDAVPVYEIRPMGNFDTVVFFTLIDFLQQIASAEVDRISVAGRIIGSKRLYNGAVVPTIEPTLRGMFSWTANALVENLVQTFKDDPTKIRTLAGEDENELSDRLRNFLMRVYYALRNVGQAPDDRAINFLATNAYDAGEVFIEAAKEKYELDTITCEQSSICRPDSLCFDVIMTFFDPTQRMERARKQFRRTVDVSDVVPVNVGGLRSWYVY